MKPRSEKGLEPWLGGARMPYNTEWVRGGYPTTLNGWGAGAPSYWVGGGRWRGMEARNTRWEGHTGFVRGWRVRLQDGLQDGGGHTVPEEAGLGGIRPWR